MTVNEFMEARRRMTRLLTSEEIEKRVSRLPVKRAEFTADILSGVAASSKNTYLNESEVFALFELAAKMHIRLNEEKSGAFLTNMNGHPALTMDFSNLYRLYKQMQETKQQAQ